MMRPSPRHPRSALPLSLVVATLTALALGYGCGGSGDSAPDSGTDVDALCSISVPAGCPAPAPVYADVQPIFEQRCVTCHNNQPGSPWALNDYYHIADWQEAVSQMVADCEMPPADSGIPMTALEREKILTWVQCGVRQ